MKDAFRDDGENDVGKLTTEWASELAFFHVKSLTLSSIAMLGSSNAFKISRVAIEMEIMSTGLDVKRGVESFANR